jgi:Transposase domain (DUF772)
VTGFGRFAAPAALVARRLVELTGPMMCSRADPQTRKCRCKGDFHASRRSVVPSDESRLNLAYRWFCGLGLKGEVPERSSFSKTWHGRFRDNDAFRLVFENVVQTCLRAGLVSGETFATDASVIEADARVMRRTEDAKPPEDWNDPGNVTRPVREYLDQLDKAAGLALAGEKPSRQRPRRSQTRTRR